MKGRGAVACASATPIRANAVSEDMSLNVRERAEGFPASAVAEKIPFPPERAEGFPASTVAVATSLPSERAEGFLQLSSTEPTPPQSERAEGFLAVS